MSSRRDSEWTIQDRILRALRYGPMVVTEIEVMTGDLHQSVSPQLSQLAHNKKVVKLKDKRVNAHGVRCALWELAA